MVLAALFSLGGCAYRIEWPHAPSPIESGVEGPVRRYAIGSGGKINYVQHLSNGRIQHLEFDDNADGTPEAAVDLAAAYANWPHFLIILDGVPFRVVHQLYEEGRFRLFEPPQPVVSVYPAMTDLALSRLFGTPPCVAYEALWYDRDLGKMAGGNAAYLEGENAPWLRDVDYAAPQDVAVGTYINPPSVFDRELREMHRLFREHPGPFASAYSVGTAGLGTRGGAAAIREYLIEIDRLCERVTYERRGRVRFSITADHGHGLRRCRRVSLKDTLRRAGFTISKTLNGSKDVVQPEYGLVTFAQFFTDAPQDVAAELVRHQAADIVSFAQDDRVIVLKRDQRADILKGESGYFYQPVHGDPLEIEPIIAAMRDRGFVSEDGEIDDREFLRLSVNSTYPDALHRLWECHHTLVRRPADVVVSLKPGFCVGSKFFNFMIGPVASTHGALDSASSVTFLLTNRPTGEIADVLRIGDVVGEICNR